MNDITLTQSQYLLQCWACQEGMCAWRLTGRKVAGIYTQDGRKIFDLRSAYECINLEFRHPKVLEAMKAQMEKVGYRLCDR